jgi:hypothetical protein
MLRKADDTSETITGYLRGRPDPLNTVRENDPSGLVLYLRAAAPYRRIPARHQRQFWTTVGAPTPGHNRRGNPSAMGQQLVGARVMLAAVTDCDLGRHIGHPRVVSPLPAMPAPLCGCHPMAVSYLRTFARTGPLIAVTMAKA